VIPSNVRLSGTLRDFSPSVASTVEQRMRDILKHTCAAYGVEGELIIHDKYPVLVNPKDTTAIVQNIGKRVVGADSVSSKGLPVSGSEDFSYFLQERPGCYFFVGTIDEAHSQSRNCHSDAFDFNDDIMPLAVRMFLEIVQDRFKCELYSHDELALMTAPLLGAKSS
ncbi:hypothetical protein As57867_014748, partial [Aphanomyces stellatus]